MPVNCSPGWIRRSEGIPRRLIMAGHSDSRSRTKWGDKDIVLLKKLARDGTPTSAIALRLGRSKAAISCKASELGIKLGETSQAQTLDVELNMLENEIREFEAIHPQPNEWSPQQAAYYDSLTKRHVKLRAEIAELTVRRQ